MEITLENFKLLAYLEKIESKTFSITNFLESKNVTLFLLNNAAYSKKLNPLFTGFIAILIEALLSKPDTKSDLTLFLLNEYLSLNFDIDIRIKLMTQVRSKGGCLILGTQYIPKDKIQEQQLLDSSRYALYLFRIGDKETIQHLQYSFGDIFYEYINSNWSFNRSSTSSINIMNFSNTSGTTVGQSTNLHRRQFLTPEMLQSIDKFHHITFIPEENLLYLAYTPLISVDKSAQSFIKRNLSKFYLSYENKYHIDFDGNEFSEEKTLYFLNKYSQDEINDIYI